MPATASPVAASQRGLGARRHSSHSNNPANKGLDPSATTVPTATPLARVPAKKVAW